MEPETRWQEIKCWSKKVKTHGRSNRDRECSLRERVKKKNVARRERKGKMGGEKRTGRNRKIKYKND